LKIPTPVDNEPQKFLSVFKQREEEGEETKSFPPPSILDLDRQTPQTSITEKG